MNFKNNLIEYTCYKNGIGPEHSLCKYYERWFPEMAERCTVWEIGETEMRIYGILISHTGCIYTLFPPRSPVFDLRCLNVQKTYISIVSPYFYCFKDILDVLLATL
jgi:hypothetical protein